MAKTVSTTILRGDDGIAFGVRFETEGQPTIELTLDALTGPILAEAAVHGLKQKIGDAAAIGRDGDTGASASPAAKYGAMAEIADRLTSDDPTWNSGRGEGGGQESLLLAALKRVKPSADPAPLAAWLEKRSAKEQSDLRRSTTFAPVIATIKAERAAKAKPKATKAVDVAALEAELDGI